MKSFPFNETLKQNVLTVISRVFDFYTFEDYYLDSPPPFQDSTTNIRAQLARINQTHYEVGVARVVYRMWEEPLTVLDRRTLTSTRICTISRPNSTMGTLVRP